MNTLFLDGLLGKSRKELKSLGYPVQEYLIGKKKIYLRNKETAEYFYSRYLSGELLNDLADSFGYPRSSFWKFMSKNCKLRTSSEARKLNSQKIIQTNLKRYGVENPFQAEIFKEKLRNTNLKKYGVEYPFQSAKILKLRQDNAFKKTGSKSPLGSKEAKESQKATWNSKQILKLQKKFDKHFVVLLDSYDGGQNKDKTWKKYRFLHLQCNREFYSSINGVIRCTHCFPRYGHHRSLLEDGYSRFVESLGFSTVCNSSEFLRSYVSKKALEVDISVEDKKVLFEINGLFWHSCGHSYGDSWINMFPEYHEIKTESAVRQGYELFHIWERDSEEIVRELIKDKLGVFYSKILSKNFNISEISKDEFIEFHKANSLEESANVSRCFACFYEGKMVLAIGGVIRENLYKITGYSRKLGVFVKFGFSKLMDYIVEQCMSERVLGISLELSRDWNSDYRKTDFYKYGFTFVGYLSGTLKFTDCSKIYLMDSQKVEDLVGGNSAELFIKGELIEILRSHKLYPIYDSGKLQFKYTILNREES